MIGVPAVVVAWHSIDSGWLKVMNSPRAQAEVYARALEMNTLAGSVFISRSHHDSQPPEIYLKSFGVRRIRFLGKKGWEAYNHDRTAEWVEFGAHAGGKTPILKYRCYGVAMDIMNAATRFTRGSGPG